MSLFSMSITKQKNALALIIWCVALLGIGTGNLINPNLWFDEALQMWASRGQYHYANYDTVQANTIKAAVKANCTNTWDPPGFTILLNLLGKITAQLWIFRSLTLLFFALSCLMLTMLARKWAPQYLLSSISGLILLLSPLLCHYAFEIRPYSMELFHATLALYLACACDDSWSKKKCLLYGIVLALGMMSRYTSVFPAILAASFIAAKFFYTPDNPSFFILERKRLLRFLCLFIPSLLSGLTIIALIDSKQLFQTSESVAYHRMFLISSNPGEFFNCFTLLLWLPVIIIIALRFLPTKILPSLARKYDLYITFVVVFNLLKLLLDFGHFTPYSLTFRFNLPCHALLLFAWVPLLLLLFEYCSLQQDKAYWLTRLPIVCNIILIGAIVVVAFTFTREDPDQSIGYLRRLPVDPPPKILAAVNVYPALRYACELGPLNDRPHWREHIYFYGDKYPKIKDWSVQKKFEFIVNRHGDMDEIYYQMARKKGYNLILESHLHVQTSLGKRAGFSTAIIELDTDTRTHGHTD
jgi:hypothetical protein